MRLYVLAISLFLAQPAAPWANEISGLARVIDGDTLDVGDVRVRLHGVDAPEAKQSCERDGVDWLCGAASAAKLRALVDDQEVTCFQTDRDRYGRVVGVCSAGNIELGAAMVLSGLALAYRQYGQEYVIHESAARGAGRGLWAGTFVAPWDWRSGERASHPTPAAAPSESLQSLSRPRSERLLWRKKADAQHQCSRYLGRFS